LQEVFPGDNQLLELAGIENKAFRAKAQGHGEVPFPYRPDTHVEKDYNGLAAPYGPNEILGPGAGKAGVHALFPGPNNHVGAKGPPEIRSLDIHGHLFLGGRPALVCHDRGQR
jgi:hypothetical protein